MRPRPSFLVGLFVVVMSAVAPCKGADVPEDGPVGRPMMRQLGPGGGASAVPTSQDIALARPELRRRFREPLSHAASSAGATQAAEVLLAAAATETDRTLRWLMIDEARRLGESAGQAGIVTRAITAASAAYDFDTTEAELRALKQIPLRGLDASRAAGVALAAERVAARAAADSRPDQSVAAEMLAYRAWQRAGNIAAARRAAERHDAALTGRNAEANSP